MTTPSPRREKRIRRQRRRRRLQALLTALCCVLLIAISTVASLMLFPISREEEQQQEQAMQTLRVDPSLPFTLADLTSAQVAQIRREGSLRVSDGPRGVSVGDSLDTLLSRLPSSYTQRQADPDATGEQSDEQQVIYCQETVVNSRGVQVALPPRGLLNVDAGSIIVTLLAPTSAYPPGTTDDYLHFEHVYCRYVIDPESMTITSITLGIS